MPDGQFSRVRSSVRLSFSEGQLCISGLGRSARQSSEVIGLGLIVLSVYISPKVNLVFNLQGCRSVRFGFMDHRYCQLKVDGFPNFNYDVLYQEPFLIAS